MPLLMSSRSLVAVAEARLPDEQATSSGITSREIDTAVEGMSLKAVREVYALLNAPGPDELDYGGGFVDVMTPDSLYSVQQGLDFSAPSRWNIIWRARWIARVAPMAKQSLRIFCGFCLNTGIPKPLTKTTRQHVRNTPPKDDPSATPTKEAGDPEDSDKVDGTPDTDPIQQVIDDFWDDPDNAELCNAGGMEETLTRRQIDGALLWALFTDPTTGHVKCRRVDPVRIVDIFTDPQDGVRPLYYQLRSMGTADQMGSAGNLGGYVPGQGVPGNGTATIINASPDPSSSTGMPGTGSADTYYRDWNNTDPDRDHYRSRIELMPGYQDGVMMAHFPINRLGKFGLSELFAGADWLRAHKRFNENRATLTEALRRIALLLTVKGGQQQVSAAQTALQSSIAGQGISSGWEQNPPPAAGSIWAQNSGVNLEQFKVDTGASDAAKDSEGLLQMFAASTGFATHYFGSSQMHTLAVATAMELPILRFLQSSQTGISDMLRQIVDFALKEAVRAQQIPDATVVQKFGYERVDWGTIDASYDVEMPPIVNSDAAQTIAPIVTANQAGLIDDEAAAYKILVTLGVDNPDEQLARWRTWHESKQEQDHLNALQLKTAAPMPGDPHQPGGGDGRPAVNGAKRGGPSTAQTQRDNKAREAGTDGPLHQFASTQFDLPPEQAACFRRVANSIADEHLADDGRELAPHITCLYGLHDTYDTTIAAITDICRQTPPIVATLGAVQQFSSAETGQDFAVLTVPAHSADLPLLRTLIAQRVPNTQTHPRYQPHITLAYVKPDTARWYLGMDPFQGVEVVLDRLTVSDRAGHTVQIPLLGSPRSREEPS